MNKRNIIGRMLAIMLAVVLFPAVTSAQSDSTAVSSKKEKFS